MVGYAAEAAAVIVVTRLVMINGQCLGRAALHVVLSRLPAGCAAGLHASCEGCTGCGWTQSPLCCNALSHVPDTAGCVTSSY
jgi:hypothetical protein